MKLMLDGTIPSSLAGRGGFMAVFQGLCPWLISCVPCGTLGRRLRSKAATESGKRGSSWRLMPPSPLGKRCLPLRTGRQYGQKGELRGVGKRAKPERRRAKTELEPSRGSPLLAFARDCSPLLAFCREVFFTGCQWPIVSGKWSIVGVEATCY
jgi:hypothetical protein